MPTVSNTLALVGDTALSHVVLASISTSRSTWQSFITSCTCLMKRYARHQVPIAPSHIYVSISKSERSLSNSIPLPSLQRSARALGLLQKPSTVSFMSPFRHPSIITSSHMSPTACEVSFQQKTT